MTFSRYKKRLITREDYKAGNFFNRIWPDFLGDFAEGIKFDNGRMDYRVELDVFEDRIYITVDDFLSHTINHYNKYWIDYCEFRLEKTGVEVNGDYFRRKANNHIHDMKVVNFYFEVKKILKAAYHINSDIISNTPADFYHETMSAEEMALRQWASLNPFRLFYITPHAHHRTA